LVVFPNCKINLGLHIVRKREDGYHDLETIFYPLPLRDALEITRSEAGSRMLNERQAATLHMSGLPVQGKAEDNLCFKAYNLLKKDHPQLPDVHMYLHKAIPMGAGLGGGSADGAFTLQLLNEKFQLSLSREKLLDYSLQLGSDCPFFIINKPCYATGRGELLQTIQLDLSGYSFLVVQPGVHISTSRAFSQLTPAPSPEPLQEIIQQPVTSWRTPLKNDFEAPVFIQYPDLKAIKEKLYEAGALYASMTGSGSCFFGIFPKHQLPAIQWPAHYSVFNLQ
jgi:4-diphosphocytidyl-2-C-methyl-D-erythritol kinase